MTQTLAPMSRTVLVRCSPERAFTVFTEQIGSWWSLESHTAFEGDSSTVRFEDGLLIERATDRRTDTWGEVLTFQPPTELSFTWHPSRPEGPDTIVLVTFTAEGGGTRVDLEHVGWEVFGDDAEDRRAGYSNDDGWPNVINRFVTHIGLHD